MKKTNENKNIKENNTQKFIKSIKENATKFKGTFETRNLNKLSNTKNMNITLKQFYNIKNLDSGKIESVNIKPLDNKVTLKLNNGFVDQQFNKLYDIDINQIKSNLNNAYEMMSFNSLIYSELKNNIATFLKALLE